MKLRRDHLLHAETCALIVVTASLLIPLWWAAAVALVASVSKELWDKNHGGCASWADIGADIIGIAGGSLLAWLTIICSVFV